MKILLIFTALCDKVAKRISAIVEASVVFALMGVLGLVIFTIVSRYFFHVSAPWVFELVTIGIAYVATFGFSCLVQRKSLLSITFLSDRIPPKGKVVFHLCMWILFVMYFQWFVTNGVAFAENVRGQLSPSGVFDLFYPRLIIPAGGVLIIFQGFNNVMQYFVRVVVPDGNKDQANVEITE